jgi:hypothetical protein
MSGASWKPRIEGRGQVHVDLVEELMAAAPHLSLEIGSDDWDVYVLGVNRIGADSFVQLALIGPRFCTVTARVPAADDPDTKARELIVLMLRWLGSEPRGTQAFLESPHCVSARA